MQPDPPTLEAYTAQFHRNQKVTGYGIDVTMHMPCPGCAQPGFMDMSPMQAALAPELPWAGDHTCENCGRAFRFTEVRGHGSLGMTMGQIAGPDLPPYLPPMKRLEA